MKVKFFSLSEQYESIKKEVDFEISKISENQNFVLGESVSKFEQNFAKVNDSKYCITVNSGTSALHTALSILGIKHGDEVLVPSNSFFATAEAVSLTGATPVFVDVDSDLHHIDLIDAKNKVTKKTKCIIPVHLYGNPVDMIEVNKFARTYSLFVVEDCAQAHFAKFQNKHVGNFGNIGCFSFYPSKNLGAYGEGGALVTNNKQIYENAIMYRNHGSKNRYEHEFIGHNYRLNGIQAAVLGVKLKYAKSWNSKRIKLANRYRKKIYESEELFLPIQKKEAKHVFHLFVIRHKQRNSLKKYLEEKGIETSLHYPIPIHKQKAYQPNNYKKMKSELISNEILSLPLYPELPNEAIDYVSEIINSYN
tara:strand:- start:2904 stop:3995 length:1092 start_codon:yes stop_codon:yes gene_type:complete